MKNFISTSAIIIGLCACFNLHAQSTNIVASPTDPNGNVNTEIHQNPSDPTNSATNPQLQQQFNTDGNGYENLTPANIMDSQNSGMGSMISDKKDSTQNGSQNQAGKTKKTKKHTH